MATLVISMMSACSDDGAEKHVEHQVGKQPRAIVVQIPAVQMPVPQMSRQYVVPPQPQTQPPLPDSSNPWAVRTHPRSNRQYRPQQWGQPEPRQPQQYVQPPTGLQYRPLEPEPEAGTPRTPAIRQPRQDYRPLAPYDRLSGSSFGAPGYPYGGTYPGYYGYGAPGGIYPPAWPGTGWPGYW